MLAINLICLYGVAVGTYQYTGNVWATVAATCLAYLTILATAVIRSH